VKARSVGTFVQIGGMIINMARVVEGTITDDEVRLYSTPRDEGLEKEYPAILKGEKYEAFLEWWERQAVLTALTPYRISPASACYPSPYELGAKRAGPG